jgi:putative GTP pyrophosphokinase
VPKVLELQIKTLFQHAWSEANHDLGYKPDLQPLDPDDERKLAFTAAQAWGADQIFDELYRKRAAH